MPHLIQPSNETILGFHPLKELYLLNKHQRTLPFRGDLTLPYVYEVPTEFNIGGELITLPVTEYVHRRDINLEWAEIKAFLLDGTIPVRYGPRVTADGIIHEPMNEDNFRKLVRRFYLLLTPIRPWLFEHGTRLPVDTARRGFTEAVNRLLMVHGGQTLREMPWRELATAVQRANNSWHIDTEIRVHATQLELRHTWP
ncbi:hypothetical protein DFH07DRAFT_1014738 [Mycena maculata]|uniref:Uncharacterized protein n=1 Tax=Mycena maculata TaxID=230809 RepID=A0AAD7H964_9AGAR|nr:hypothetical protein DFH07DRAFT_1014738 [Mycena maculata]